SEDSSTESPTGMHWVSEMVDSTACESTSSTIRDPQLAGLGDRFADAAEGLDEIEIRVELVEHGLDARQVIRMLAAADQRRSVVDRGAHDNAGVVGRRFTGGDPDDRQINGVAQVEHHLAIGEDQRRGGGGLLDEDLADEFAVQV